MLFWIFGFFAIPAVLLLGGYLMANHPTPVSYTHLTLPTTELV